MTDIILSKPAPGVARQVPCTPGIRFVVDFIPEDSTVSVDDDDIIFTFDDESQIHLVDYAVAYASGSMPDFYFPREEAEVEGRVLWEAITMDDLMPGESPAAPSPSGSASYLCDAASDLMPGVPQTEDPTLLSYVHMLQTVGSA